MLPKRLWIKAECEKFKSRPQPFCSQIIDLVAYPEVGEGWKKNLFTWNRRKSCFCNIVSLSSSRLVIGRTWSSFRSLWSLFLGPRCPRTARKPCWRGRPRCFWSKSRSLRSEQASSSSRRCRATLRNLSTPSPGSLLPSMTAQRLCGQDNPGANKKCVLVIIRY